MKPSLVYLNYIIGDLIFGPIHLLNESIGDLVTNVTFSEKDEMGH